MVWALVALAAIVGISVLLYAVRLLDSDAWDDSKDRYDLKEQIPPSAERAGKSGVSGEDGGANGSWRDQADRSDRLAPDLQRASGSRAVV